MSWLSCTSGLTNLLLHNIKSLLAFNIELFVASSTDESPERMNLTRAVSRRLNIFLLYCTIYSEYALLHLLKLGNDVGDDKSAFLNQENFNARDNLGLG